MTKFALTFLLFGSVSVRYICSEVTRLKRFMITEPSYINIDALSPSAGVVSDVNLSLNSVRVIVKEILYAPAGSELTSLSMLLF